MMPFSIVVPANAGTRNHRLESCPLAANKKATTTVLSNFAHRAWVPAFAGTTK